MDICNLGKTNVILGMPWLAAHNPEINWETGEVKITRYLSLYGKIPKKKIIKTRKTKKINIDNEIDLRWVIVMSHLDYDKKL